ncbi:hypothetical protein [Thioalkalivibrio sp. HK1]|nr:hypothetical protein [Thioalkalivibrio sp. HK1]
MSWKSWLEYRDPLSWQMGKAHSDVLVDGSGAHLRPQHIGLL